jgi:DNA-binding transcriptional LysR family regulator
MEIYQLRYFEATARTGSIGAAAKTCQVQQPTLSVQIKALENELGTPLFKRHARGVKLTRAGERLLHTVRHLMDELDQLRRDFARRRYGTQRTLRIGIQPFLATELLARSLKTFIAAMPGWQVTLRERPNALLLELLLNREADVCLMTKAARWPAGLEARKLFEVPFAAYCRRNHPLAAKGRIALRDLLPFPLILWNDPTDTAGHLRPIARKLALELHVVFSSDMAATAFAMAAEGMGVAVLPDVFASRCGRAMLPIPIVDRQLRTTVCAVWRRDRPVPVGLEELITLCRESITGSD